MYDRIILDLTSEFRKFRETLEPLVDEFDEFARETIASILQYVYSASGGEDVLQHFADDVEKGAAENGNRSEEEVTTIRDAVLELGDAIFKHLMVVGAYDSDGHLAFKLHDITGDDIVLTPLTPEDYAAMGEDDTPVEDPNELARQAADQDTAALYAGGVINDGFSTDDEAYEND